MPKGSTKYHQGLLRECSQVGKEIILHLFWFSHFGLRVEERKELVKGFKPVQLDGSQHQFDCLKPAKKPKGRDW